MIRYEDFEQKVLEQVKDNGTDWKHLLPSIPLAFRNRFLQTVEQGFSMPESYDMVMLCQKLMPDEYDAFLNKALEKKNNKLSGSDLKEKLASL